VTFRNALQNAVFYVLFVPWTFFVSVSEILLGYIPGTRPVMRKLELLWARLAVFASRARPEVDSPQLDPEQNYIFVANHQSYLDIPMILSAFPLHFPRFLAKESLFRIPFFGPGMRKLGHLPVNRENRRKGMEGINDAVRRAGSGESILIFPEGTRNESDGGTLQDFQIGAFLIALKSGLPVVPVIVDGTGEVLPKGSFRLRPGHTTLHVFEPLDASGYSLRERERFREELRSYMQNRLSEIRQWKSQRTA
jgi:1-acyl-sn-glycerol-3-phosphate acyltransferase